MRILIIQPWIRLGGAETLSLELSAALERRGHEVPIAALFVDPAGLPDIVRDRAYVLPPRRLAERFARSRTLSFLLGPFVLLGLVARASAGIDVLDPHNLPGPIVAAIVGPVRGIPVVWNLNEVPVPLPPEQAQRIGLVERLVWIVGAALARWSSRVPKEVLVLDEKTKRSVRAHYGLEATIAMPGLRVESFEATAPRRAVGGVTRLLCVGKLHPQKNVVLAIETVAELRRRGRAVALRIVGDGPLRAELALAAARLGVADAVSFRALLSLAELAREYAAADVLLVTPTGHQAWGLTPFEAIAAGTPSVVSDEAGAAEVLAAHDAALVTAAAPTAFADAVERLVADPALAEGLVRNGRALLRDELTWPRYAERCERAFRAAGGRRVWSGRAAP